MKPVSMPSLCGAAAGPGAAWFYGRGGSRLISTSSV